MATANLDTELDIHPLCALFPPMGDDEMISLVEDVRANGLRESIVLYEQRVLDGRNRLEACRQADVEPSFIDWDGVGSPLDYVISKNLNRRHLDESQRGYVAARIAEFSGSARKHATRSGEQSEENATKSENQDGGSIEPIRHNVLNDDSEPVTNDQASALLNVSKATVKRARKVLREGGEKLNQAVESGEISVADAAAIADRPEEVQEQAVEAKKSGKTRTAKEAAEQISPKPPKKKSNKGGSGGTDKKKQFQTACGKFEDLLGKTLRALDDIAEIYGEDKFIKGVREGFPFIKTKLAELRRAHR